MRVERGGTYTYLIERARTRHQLIQVVCWKLIKRKSFWDTPSWDYVIGDRYAPTPFNVQIRGADRAGRSNPIKPNSKTQLSYIIGKTSEISSSNIRESIYFITLDKSLMKKGAQKISRYKTRHCPKIQQKNKQMREPSGRVLAFEIGS